jgi:hypothetical protein
LREPATVAADLAAGIYDAKSAGTLYGVVLDHNGGVNLNETERRRAEIRRHRIESGKPASVQARQTQQRGLQYTHVPDICLEVRPYGGNDCFACGWCSTILGPTTLDIRNYTITVEHGLSSLSPLNRFAGDERVAVLSFCCPSCGTGLTSEVQLLGDGSHRPEIELAG